MNLRQTIADRMTELDVSQRNLEALTGICQSRICDYLTGKRDMVGDNVALMLEALDLEVRPKRRKKGR